MQGIDSLAVDVDRTEGPWEGLVRCDVSLEMAGGLQIDDRSDGGTPGRAGFALCLTMVFLTCTDIYDSVTVGQSWK